MGIKNLVDIHQFSGDVLTNPCNGAAIFVAHAYKNKRRKRTSSKACPMIEKLKIAQAASPQ